MPAVDHATEFRVFVGGPEGAEPDYEAHDPAWQCLSVRKAIGGVCEAMILYDLGREGRLQDTNLLTLTNRIVEIWAYKNDELLGPVFRGEIVGRNDLIAPQESRVYKAALRPHHFGDQPSGATYWHPIDSEPLFSWHNFFFNPIVDGKARGNRDATNDGVWSGSPFETARHFYLLDPEQGLSEQALTALGVEAATWDLRQITAYFLWTINEDEWWVKNPAVAGTTAEEVAAELESVMIDVPEAKDLKYPAQLTLPQYLTAVLDPHGYGWCVDYEWTTVQEDRITPRIRIFTRGIGIDAEHEWELKLDPIGEVVDQSEVEQASFNCSLETLPQNIAAYGPFLEEEVTMPLYKAWDDAIEVGNIPVESESFVGRAWVANEGWDYSGVRPEIQNPYLGDPFVGSIGTAWIPRRRKAEDCLTTYIDQTTNKPTRRPPYVEYRKDTESGWLPVPEEWGYRVLPDQIGIKFHSIPDELLDDEAEVRMTCTIQGDVRLEKKITCSDLQDESQPLHTITSILDLSDRFHLRRRRSAGAYASVLTTTADTVDDEEKLETYLTKLTETLQILPTSGAATLCGLLLNYGVGDLLYSVSGRNIDLKLTTFATTERYVQIAAVTWDCMQQKTILEYSSGSPTEVA